ncbi:MAG: CDP-glycerol glycerophosphotransferase family protein, partial [Floccifex sp.]
IIDVSFYDDMQELLVACNVLISDYSSVISEFAITGKPVFLYAEDITAYALERDFYIDYFSLPFPIATNNEELKTNILNFSEEEYQKKVFSFLDGVGMKEYGIASKYLVDIIEKISQQEPVELKEGAL